MLINQYVLMYEDDTKKLQPIKTIQCEELDIDPEEEREVIIEKIVANLKDLLNENFSFGYLAEEHLFIVAMDADYKILGVFEVSHGTENGCDAGAREIFTRLLMVGAEKFIEFHNHPREGVMLSKEDVESWKHLKEIADLLEIELLTSAVVSGELYNYVEE